MTPTLDDFDYPPSPAASFAGHARTAPRPLVRFNPDPQHLSLEFTFGISDQGNEMNMKYNWNGTWTDLFHERILTDEYVARWYGMDVAPIEAALYVRENEATITAETAHDLAAEAQAEIEASRRKDAAEIKGMLSRINSPEMVARRGRTKLTPYGWRTVEPPSVTKRQTKEVG